MKIEKKMNLYPFGKSSRFKIDLFKMQQVHDGCPGVVCQR